MQKDRKHYIAPSSTLIALAFGSQILSGSDISISIGSGEGKDVTEEGDAWSDKKSDYWEGWDE